MHIERVSIKSTGARVIYKKTGAGEEIPYSLDSREQILENPRHNQYTQSHCQPWHLWTACWAVAWIGPRAEWLQVFSLV